MLKMSNIQEIKKLPKNSFWFIYSAKSSGNIYPLEIGNLLCKIEDLIYEPEKIWSACEKGCSNFGKLGGCPPKSPKLETFASPEDQVWLIYCRFWSEFKPAKVLQSNNIAIHWKFQDAILARFLANIGYNFSFYLNGKFLSTGYCMGCPGQKCNFKKGANFCRNPKRRTFSMEATGINVVSTIKKLFDIELFWYSKGSTIPYMLKCIVILPGLNNNYIKPNMDMLINTLNEFPNCLLTYDSNEYWDYLEKNRLS